MFKQFWQSCSIIAKFCLVAATVGIPIMFWWMLHDMDYWAFYGSMIAFNLWQLLALVDDILSGKIVKRGNLK